MNDNYENNFQTLKWRASCKYITCTNITPFYKMENINDIKDYQSVNTHINMKWINQQGLKQIPTLHIHYERQLGTNTFKIASNNNTYLSI